MAIVHASATIEPTKPELLEAMLGGPVEVLGSYRFDDPEGSVGVVAFIVRRDGQLRHVVLTYRDAPLKAPGSRLLSTMEHSELGPRWVYDGTTDPVAVECFRRAVLGDQSQAVLEVWEDGRMTGTRAPSILLRTTPGPSLPGAEVRIAADVGGADEAPALVARWADGEATVAWLGS